MKMNDIEQNKRTIQKLEAFASAYVELLHEWGDLNDIESVKLYPFKECFRDLEFPTLNWIDESRCELREINHKLEGSSC